MDFDLEPLRQLVRCEDVIWEPLREDTRAEVYVSLDEYAPWMRLVVNYTRDIGAVNGEDYDAAVSLAGFKGKKRMHRVVWTARNATGRRFIQAMANTFRVLEMEPKVVEQETSAFPALLTTHKIEDDEFTGPRLYKEVVGPYDLERVIDAEIVEGLDEAD